MSQNPLFPSSQDNDKQNSTNHAADLIRSKLNSLYTEEPNAKIEQKEAESTRVRSKHQQYMHDLTTSGKSLAEIQTAWHQYYADLPDKEKHEVWQEFYANQNQISGQPHIAQNHSHYHTGAGHTNLKPHKLTNNSSKRSLRTAIRENSHKLKPNKGHFHSLLFGLGSATVVLFIFLFGFFNEFIITPFIQPGSKVSDTPIIIDPTNTAVTAEDKIIIPKINVEIPVDYSQTSTNDAAIESALDNGVVHYPTTVKPGELGNSAFFGHSSNNIFNKGKYKFAFLLLSKLQKDDTFYLTYNKTLYTYKVVDKKIVKPSEVGVLGTVEGYAATASLITCDPPGTTINRLVVIGEQITPNPSSNTKSQTEQITATDPVDELPGNGPTLWNRFWNWITGRS